MLIMMTRRRRVVCFVFIIMTEMKIGRRGGWHINYSDEEAGGDVFNMMRRRRVMM